LVLLVLVTFRLFSEAIITPMSLLAAVPGVLTPVLGRGVPCIEDASQSRNGVAKEAGQITVGCSSALDAREGSGLQALGVDALT
jgi:hypothetical protein